MNRLLSYCTSASLEGQSALFCFKAHGLRSLICCFAGLTNVEVNFELKEAGSSYSMNARTRWGGQSCCPPEFFKLRAGHFNLVPPTMRRMLTVDLRFIYERWWYLNGYWKLVMIIIRFFSKGWNLLWRQRESYFFQKFQRSYFHSDALSTNKIFDAFDGKSKRHLLDTSTQSSGYNLECCWWERDYRELLVWRKKKRLLPTAMSPC